MKKIDILRRIVDLGVVSVVRGDSIAQTKETSLACIKGGITVIEVTYTIPGATDVIKALKEEIPGTDLIVGAGTVLDSETARIALLAGADFIVSPGFDLETAKLCNRYQVPYMAGCMTIKEMVQALEAGCDIIKLFPGRVFGPAFIKDIKGPLPQANIMPTGGVSLDNVKEWIQNGAIAVGVGGELTKGSPEEITAKSKQLLLKVKEARLKLHVGKR
ncbi:bifunctional 2-keto-4-hydroxyglutarate aldolase/2-keto-3-deoxy-6-phosphogluconate aldolase [Priestia abyssalis]|uniref:bifunctional 2-keto-4-hydroxyglutarate aldolase/2-keto-3-deoxy-6-phosphogluconate aldolase n=1 Tax=Priestia abyssalis TaxID=1221450 RepID=UPI0009956F04|nr:bifunctional 2-keto-4-hydroxyglutarate aldolase/2-keto-3-deoxy-6-phosphogluconate aldolase [Priestia abyssalis]